MGQIPSDTWFSLLSPPPPANNVCLHLLQQILKAAFMTQENYRNLYFNVHKVLLKHSHTFVCVLSTAAFVLQSQN